MRGLEWKIVLVYVDDIVIFAPTFKEHLDWLEQVFQRQQEANITLKPSKCKFAMTEIKFLGHKVNEMGISPNPEKTSIVKKFQPKIH